MRALIGCLLTACLAAAAEDDPVKAKLDKAKETYQAAREKNKTYLIDVLTKQEEVARKAGKVATVEKVKKALDEYKGGGPLPGGLAPAVRLRFSSARAAMEAAYVETVREYTKAKKDDLVTAVKKDWEAFKLDASDDPNVVRLLNKNSDKFATVTDGKGEPRVRQYAEASGTDQYWRVVQAGGGWLFLQTLDGKKLLSTEKAGVSNGVVLVAAPLRSGVAVQTQQWRMVPAIDGWSRLAHRASGKVVGVLDKSKDDGGWIVIWSNENDSPNMDWKFD